VAETQEERKFLRVSAFSNDGSEAGASRPKPSKIPDGDPGDGTLRTRGIQQPASLNQEADAIQHIHRMAGLLFFSVSEADPRRVPRRKTWSVDPPKSTLRILFSFWRQSAKRGTTSFNELFGSVRGYQSFVEPTRSPRPRCFADRVLGRCPDTLAGPQQPLRQKSQNHLYFYSLGLPRLYVPCPRALTRARSEPPWYVTRNARWCGSGGPQYPRRVSPLSRIMTRRANSCLAHNPFGWSAPGLESGHSWRKFSATCG